MDALRPAPRLPNLRLPQAEQRNAWSVLGSVLAHGLVILLIILAQASPEDESDSKRPGAPGERGGGGGVKYIRLDVSAAAQVATAQPRVVPPPEPVKEPAVVFNLPTPKLEMPVAEQQVVTAVGTPEAGAGGGSNTGVGGGVGTGMGRDSGPGVGGDGGDTFPPQVKYTILPPLPRPASLRGRSLQVHFWVDVEGRVTRVRVEPDIRDAAYRTQFLALLREYVFEPARKLDGTRVAGETTITITL